jgi:hypothetical protein
MKTLLTWSFVATIFLVSWITADRPAFAGDTGGPWAFTPISLEIDTVGHRLPNPGDTLNLLLTFTSNIHGAAVVRLNFPGYVAPPNQGVGETYRDSSISVDTGTVYTMTFPMKFFQYGASMVDVMISTAPSTIMEFNVGVALSNWSIRQQSYGYLRKVQHLRIPYLPLLARP